MGVYDLFSAKIVHIFGTFFWIFSKRSRTDYKAFTCAVGANLWSRKWSLVTPHCGECLVGGFSWALMGLYMGITGNCPLGVAGALSLVNGVGIIGTLSCTRGQRIAGDCPFTKGDPFAADLIPLT